MADLNTMIAQGPPRMDFSPLSSLFDSYGEGRKARQQHDVWSARKQAAVMGADGRPDYAATAQNLLNGGDVEGARQVAALAKDMRWARGAAAPWTAADASEETPWPKIPVAAVHALRADPSLRDQFDATYGRGYAAIVMGNPAIGR